MGNSASKVTVTGCIQSLRESFRYFCSEILYEVQVFPTTVSTTSVTGTTVVDFREISVDMTEINTKIEIDAIAVCMCIP